MKKLAISIFTYNRHIYVKQHIERIYEYAHQNGIDIYVFDGSSNDKTKMVIDRFNKDGEKIHYHQYDENAMKYLYQNGIFFDYIEEEKRDFMDCYFTTNKRKILKGFTIIGRT